MAVRLLLGSSAFSVAAKPKQSNGASQMSRALPSGTVNCTALLGLNSQLRIVLATLRVRGSNQACDCWGQQVLATYHPNWLAQVQVPSFPPWGEFSLIYLPTSNRFAARACSAHLIATPLSHRSRAPPLVLFGLRPASLQHRHDIDR